jgi:signal transduction histidine kinase/DNA-binding transcriptional ArsR family regulator
MVLTRAKRDERLHDLVAAYIHWGLFEIPGIDLDDIEIPIRTFPAGSVPTRYDVEAMLADVKRNVEELENKIGKGALTHIKNDIDVFTIDPSEIDGYLNEPKLSKEGFGTHFIIKPTSELLEMDIEGDSDKAPPLLKALLGFTNTMTPDHEPPVVETAFRDHKTDEYFDDLIGEGGFFTPEEFLNADHHIRGAFDEFGQFKGNVSVYGEEHHDHIINWRGNKGLPTTCGPFKFSLAVVQGQSRETTVPLEDHGRVIQKMNRLGGLYIYKDGIRILPYGDNDFDWLDIEKNRTKQASYYFYSYRRIFGVVEISQKQNGALTEKAGREGFRENAAYRQMKSILQNFFLQSAADFFRSPETGGGAYAERFQEKKAEISRLELARRKRKEYVAVKRDALAEGLRIYFSSVDSAKPEEEVLALIDEVTKQASEASATADPKIVAKRFLEIEFDSRKKYDALLDKYHFQKPRGVALSKAMARDWQSYEKSYAEINERVFLPAKKLIQEHIGEQVEKARIELDRRVRIQNALDELATGAKKATRAEFGQTRLLADQLQKEVKNATSESIAKLESVIKQVFDEFSRLDVTSLKESEVVEIRDSLEMSILAGKEKEEGFLKYIQAQLENVDFEDNAGYLDQLEALEERNLALEEQAEADLQLTQLGMAIEVINHEFDSSIRSIRNNLRQLKGWADANPDLDGLYSNIRANFDHLDGYLSLFTPLHRRLYRKEIEMSGSEIHKYLEDLFRERLRRHVVTLKVSQKFKLAKIIGYPSSFYPVFVNLVDNAIFWLKDRSAGEPRDINLDYEQEAFIVSDSGPGIPERDRKSIFELGFSRKPGGRGMGLHISREVLSRVNYCLDLTASKIGEGARFIIKPVEQVEK